MRTYLLLLSLLVAGPALAVVGGGEITFPVQDPGKTVFSHEAHVVKARVGCRECHPKLYLDVARSKRSTMKQMEKGKSCGACHQGKRAFELKACEKCHQ